MKDKYEEYLKSNQEIESYERDFIPIVYWDDDGQEKVFYIDFYLKHKNGQTEWVQCVPHRDLRPIKKYLYAKKISESHNNTVFRGLNEEELGATKYKF